MLPLRVLSVAHTAVTYATGRRRYEPLANRPGLDVHLLAPTAWTEFGRSMTADPVGDFPLPLHLAPIVLGAVPKAGWFCHMYPGLRRLVQRLQPDVIHLWEEPWSFVALQAVLLKGRARIVLEVDQNIMKRLPPPFEAIRRFVLARTDVILARSTDAEDIVRAKGFKGPAIPIGYGVDREIFAPRPAGPRAFAPPMKLSYVGRLLHEKGLDDVLDALAPMGRGVELVIQGEGPHKAALQARVEALGLSDRVTFRGWSSPQAVAETYRQSDVSLLMTRTTPLIKEQFGRAIIESQSCGVPVIGSTSGAIPDVIGTGGWVLPERDPAALRGFLAHLIAHPDEIAAKGERAIANVEKRFTFERVADALEASWRRAVSREDTVGQGFSRSLASNSM